MVTAVAVLLQMERQGGHSRCIHVLWNVVWWLWKSDENVHSSWIGHFTACFFACIYNRHKSGCMVQYILINTFFSHQVLQEEKMTENSARLGAIFLEKLKTLNPKIVKTVRGKGLMCAMEIFATEGRNPVLAWMGGGVLPYCFHTAIWRWAGCGPCLSSIGKLLELLDQCYLCSPNFPRVLMRLYSTAHTTVAFDEMRTQYASEQEICVPKFGNAYQWKPVETQVTHFKSTFSAKLIKRFRKKKLMLFTNNAHFPFRILVCLPWLFASHVVWCVLTPSPILVESPYFQT